MSLRLIEDKHKYLFVLTIKSVTVASKDTITCRTYSHLYGTENVFPKSCFHGK